MPRPRCQRCHHHPNNCICDDCSRVPNQTPITVLQHPSEVGRSKGTLRILEQCLDRLQVFVGEIPEHFQQAGFGAEADLAGTGILFPGPGSQALEQADLRHLHRWILVDGTWRKAAKLLHLNPSLRDLPRFHFATPPPSHYVIRKAPGNHHLATAEAAGYLLENLEPGLDTRPIGTAMAALVDKQLAQVPPALRGRYPKPQRH